MSETKIGVARAKPRSLAVSRFSATDISVAAAILAGILLLVGFVLLFATGILPVDKNSSGVKTLVAALALIGTFLTAAVSLIGIALKDSIDRRSAALAETAEQRNRIDTSIRAVGLISANGQNASKHQISGAILALLNLGEYDLAVALATQLWPEGLASRQAVAQVVREAFINGTTDTQYAVAALLLVNASLLSEGPKFVWPYVDYVWPSGAEERCRIALTFAAVECFISDLTKNSTNWPNATAPLVAALGDDLKAVRELAASALGPCLRAQIGHDQINFGTRVLTRDEIQAAVDAAIKALGKESNQSLEVEKRVNSALNPLKVPE